jgi:amino acid transporter
VTDPAATPVTPPTSEPLVRTLGGTALWLIVINGMIGAGIFGTPAGAQRLAGDFSPWVFALCAVLIAPIMLCFASLSSAFTGTGGPILYARAAFGPFVGFQVGWDLYIARLTAFAANLNLLVTTIGFFWPDAMGLSVRLGLLLLLCAGMVWVNIVGARAAMGSLGVLTVLKLLPLIGLAGIGLINLDAAVFTSVTAPPAMKDLGAPVLLVIYAYVGFESGLVPAGEARNPQRDLPRALLLALGVAACLYVLIQLAAQHLLPDLASSDRPLVDAGRVLLGPTGAVVVILAIIVSVGGNLLGSMFSTPRITYRLGLDAQLPPAFARVHPRHNTPWISVAIYGVASFALAATGSFVWLAVLSVLTRLLIYMTCIAAMPRVCGRAAAAPARFRLPAGPAIPIIALLVCIALLTRVSLVSVIATAGLLGVGSVLYLVAWLLRPPGVRQP